MNRFFLLLLLSLLPVFGFSAPSSAPVAFDLAGVSVVSFLQATYKNLLGRDYVISPEVLAMDKRFSLSVKALDAVALPAFVDDFLLAQGVQSRKRAGIYYLDVVAPVLPASSASLRSGVVGLSGEGGLVGDGLPPVFNPVRVYTPMHRPAEFMVTVINSAFGAPYARLAGAVVVLSAPEARIDEVVRVVHSLDVGARTVEVSASFVEILRSDSSGRGLSLVASVLSSRFGAAFSSTAGSLSVSAGGFQLVLDALQADGRFKQVSNSRVLGDESERMSLTVGDETPTISSAGRDNQGNGVQNIVYRPSGVILDVLPRVLGSGRLSLLVDGQISSFQATVTGVTGSPTLIKRQVKTSVTVADGEVVIIGGLDDTKSSAGRSGFSFLPRSWAGGASSDSHTDLVLILSAKASPGARVVRPDDGI